MSMSIPQSDNIIRDLKLKAFDFGSCSCGLHHSLQDSSLLWLKIKFIDRL